MSILLLTALLVVLSTQTASGVGDVDEAEYSRSDRSVEMRTCEDLGFPLIPHKDYTNFATRDSHASASVYVSKAYRFGYVRLVGKTAGTTISKGYLIPAFCNMFRDSLPRSSESEKLFGGATIPDTCRKYLQEEDLFGSLPINRSTLSYLANITTFAAVRNPFERFMSVYEYSYNDGALSKHAIHFQTLELFCSKNKLPVNSKSFNSLIRKSEHAEKKYTLFKTQGDGLTNVCDALPRTVLIPIEPDVLRNLAPLMSVVNESRGSALPPIEDPRQYTSRNRFLRSCPWQCSYELVQSCFDFVYNWYDIDVRLLHEFYGFPETVDDLWQNTWSTVANRTKECEKRCWSE